MFKIRDKSTGLYSLGGSYPNFTKNGKSFNDMRAVHLHYNVINTDGGRHGVDPTLIKDVYKNCELVEFAITEIEITEIRNKK